MINILQAVLLALSVLSVASVDAKTPKPHPQVQQAEPNEADLQDHGHYTNKAGQEVHSPSRSKTGSVPAGASAKCRDGTYSFSRNHRGTCSGHGGVAEWL